MSVKQQGRIVFQASGGDFIVFCIKSAVLVLVTFGLYSFFLPRALRCWKISHASLQGQPLKFVGGTWGFVMAALIDAVLMTITFGLYLPWSVVAQQGAGINNMAVAFTAAPGRSLGFPLSALLPSYFLWV